MKSGAAQEGGWDNGSDGKVSLSQLPEGNETTPVSTGQEKKKLLAAMSPAVMLIFMGIFGFIVGGMIYISAYYYINGESWVNTILRTMLLGIIMYVLDKGKIVASGTCDELLGSNEQFKKMARVRIDQ